MEVVLAIGIASFSLILLVALVPLGLKSNRDSMQESLAINLLQALIADRQSSDFSTNSSIYNLPALTAVTSVVSGTNYIMSDGKTITNQPNVAQYCVTYSIYPSSNLYSMATNYPVSGPPQPVTINFKVSWPAPQTNQPSSVEAVATFLQ